MNAFQSSCLLRVVFTCVLLGAIAQGCGGGDGSAAPDAEAHVDAGHSDGGTRVDGGTNDGGARLDGSMAVPDAGPAVDAGAPEDAAVLADGGELEGDSCDSARMLGAGVFTGQTARGYHADYMAGSSISCPVGAGPGRLYRVSIPAGMRMRAALDVTTGGTSPTLALILGDVDACRARPLVCDDTIPWIGPSAVDVRHSNTSARDETAWLFVVDDARASAGFDFTLTIELDSPPPGDRCDNAIALTPGTRTDAMAGFASDYGGGTGCFNTGGEDRLYAIDVPAGQYLTVALTPPEESPSLTISLVVGDVAACSSESRTCVANENTADPAPVTTVRYHNATASAQHVFIVLDTQFPRLATPMPFTLTTSLGGPPPGDLCSNAELITPSTLTGQTTHDYGAEYGAGTNCSGFGGRDRVYAIDVPAGMRLVAKPIPEDAVDLRIVAGPASACDASPIVCLDSVTSPPLVGRRTVRYVNRGASTERVFLMADGLFAGSSADFDLFTALYPASPPHAGDTCDTATALGAGTTMGSTVGFADDFDQLGATGCGATLGLDRMYRVVVPTGQRLRVNAGTAQVALNLVRETDGCMAGALRCVDGTSSGVHQIEYVNYVDPPTPLILVVDNEDPSDLGVSYTLDVAFDVLPAGDVCSTAEAVSLPFMRSGETTVGYVDDYRAGLGCAGASIGPDRIYRATVPAGRTFRAIVTPEGSFDPSLQLVVGEAVNCDALPRRCAASASAGFDGESETLTYTNDTATDQQVFLSVDAFDAGRYALVATLL